MSTILAITPRETENFTWSLNGSELYGPVNSYL
jgi:hypothetical protein